MSELDYSNVQTTARKVDFQPLGINNDLSHLFPRLPHLHSVPMRLEDIELTRGGKKSEDLPGIKSITCIVNNVGLRSLKLEFFRDADAAALVKALQAEGLHGIGIEHQSSSSEGDWNRLGGKVSISYASICIEETGPQSGQGAMEAVMAKPFMRALLPPQAVKYMDAAAEAAAVAEERLGRATDLKEESWKMVLGLPDDSTTVKKFIRGKLETALQ
jgi:hypothetical protein